MIDIRTEELITLAKAASELPPRRLGRRAHVSTLYRWVGHGLRGVRLEAVQVGGTRCTSREALQRFFDRLDYPPDPDDDPYEAQPLDLDSLSSTAAGQLGR